MFPLRVPTFPQSASDLERALEESFRRYVHKDGPIVTASSRVFPYFDQIAINLDGAKFDSPFMPTIEPPAESKEACEAALVTLSARDVRVQGLPVSLRLEARDVVFDSAASENGEILLIVRKARDGQVVVSTAQLDLESALLELARAEAAKKGVAVENLRLALRARGARSLAADVQFQARKFLLRAKIDIYGQLDITEDFVARISKLKCKGDGALATIACGVLDPHLHRIDGSTFPLMSLPLGEIKLRDMRIAVADTVEVTADFGNVES